MFRDSARFYDTLYSFKDYAAEAERVEMEIRRRNPPAASLLDVACGTGAHLIYFARSFTCEGIDLSPEQLAVAAQRLPDVPLLEADMVSFDLGRRFDAVTCLFSSIGYVLTVERMEAAVARMAAHLNPGGVLVVEPWLKPEDWMDGHVSRLFIDEPDLAIARIALSERDGRISRFDFHHLIGTTDGVEHVVEQHELGMFSDGEYASAFARAGLAADHDPEGLIGRGLWFGVAPG
jgi:ubiquinone/menaquinone biosynthesis C-methylase UbiE